MDCDTAREALSARIDAEREPIPAARVDEHLETCASCRDWQAAAVEQTQLLRRLAGRSQVAAVRPLPQEPARRLNSVSVSASWRRWALGGVGVVQLLLAIAGPSDSISESNTRRWTDTSSTSPRHGRRLWVW